MLNGLLWFLIGTLVVCVVMYVLYKLMSLPALNVDPQYKQFFLVLVGLILLVFVLILAIRAAGNPGPGWAL